MFLSNTGLFSVKLSTSLNIYSFKITVEQQIPQQTQPTTKHIKNLTNHTRASSFGCIRQRVHPSLESVQFRLELLDALVARREQGRLLHLLLRRGISGGAESLLKSRSA